MALGKTGRGRTCQCSHRNAARNLRRKPGGEIVASLPTRTIDFDYFKNLTPAMVPFRQTSWHGLALDANAMLNWRGRSIAPLTAIRAPALETSTTLQSRLAKQPSITSAGKSRFIRRSARFCLLKNIALGCLRIGIKPYPPWFVPIEREKPAGLSRRV
jgi:hypothetical protein